MGIVFSGHYSVSPNTALRVWFWYSDPNAGPVFAEPREFQGSTRNNPLVVTAYGTSRNSDNSMSYFIDVFNKGTQTATFELMRGLFSY